MYIFVAEHDLGRVLEAPTDVYLPGQPVPVQPDIFFVKKERLNIIAEDAVHGIPDLVVEILSPSNESYDRTTKMKLYAQVGVPAYWMVAYWQKVIAVYALKDGGYQLVGEFQADDIVRSEQMAGFEVVANTIFA